jgi:hypothetical protein
MTWIMSGIGRASLENLYEKKRERSFYAKVINKNLNELVFDPTKPRTNNEIMTLGLGTDVIVV